MSQAVSVSTALPAGSGGQRPNTTGPRLVAEASLYHLVVEMVSTLLRQQSERTAAETVASAASSTSAATPASAAASANRDREIVYAKLEMIGFNVGRRIVESLARDHPHFAEPLDVVKFICKDFWTTVFLKQVDNLRTNHRGVFVLQDSQFYWFANAGDNQPTLQDTTRSMTPYLWFPCGLVRGALAGLGISATVVAESTGIPLCTFQIKLSAAG